MKKILILIVETAVRKLVKVEPVKESNSLKNTLEELVKALNSNNRTVFWTPIKLLILSSIITFATTYYITMNSVDKVVDSTQENYEKQEKATALKLLELAEADILGTAFTIKDFESRQNKADGNLDTIINSWTESGITLPYPIVFTKVMTDDRILVNLSNTSLHTIYSLGESLDKDRNTIMYSSASSSIKLFYYGKYKSDLEQLYFLLNEEIKYQKGDSSEEKVAKAYSDSAMRISGLSEEEFKRRLRE